MIPKWVACFWFGCPILGGILYNQFLAPGLGVSHAVLNERLYVFYTMLIWYAVICILVWAWNDEEPEEEGDTDESD